MHRKVAAAAAVALLGLAACKGNCRQLSEKMCDCATNTPDRENCLSAISQEASRVAPTPDQEQVCGALLKATPGCDCHHVDTLEGKRACGMAR